MTELAELAIHESGHAVAANAYNIGFSHVSLYPSSDSSAHVALTGRNDNEGFTVQTRAGAMIITLLAGGYAVRHAANDRARGTWDVWGASTDYENAWKLMPYVGVDWEWLKRKTRLFVALHWPEIIRVARALDEHKIMTQSSIKRLIEEEERCIRQRI